MRPLLTIRSTMRSKPGGRRNSDPIIGKRLAMASAGGKKLLQNEKKLVSNAGKQASKQALVWLNTNHDNRKRDQSNQINAYPKRFTKPQLSTRMPILVQPHTTNAMPKKKGIVPRILRHWKNKLYVRGKPSTSATPERKRS